jgi:hypothetical protein
MFMQTIRSVVVSALVILVVVAAERGAVAHDFVADQEALTGNANGTGLLFNSPCGQEFVPQQSELDVVEVYLSLDADVPSGASVAVRVRSQDIDGEIVGTSNELVMTSPASKRIRHFDFDQPVPLLRGQVYVLEIFIASGDGSPVIWGGEDVYAAGRPWILDSFRPFQDFWFREGSVDAPEDVASWGQVKSNYR